VYQKLLTNKKYCQSSSILQYCHDGHSKVICCYTVL